MWLTCIASYCPRSFVSTGNHSFSVPLFVRTDSHKFLPQIWRYVSVAVNKDPDRLLQWNCCQVFHLQSSMQRLVPAHITRWKRSHDRAPGPLRTLWRRITLFVDCRSTAWWSPSSAPQSIHPTFWDQRTTWKSQVSLSFCFFWTTKVSGHLSASSRISISMWLSSKLGVLWRWSISLPGVAIKTSGPALRATSWDFRSNPPGYKGASYRTTNPTG